MLTADIFTANNIDAKDTAAYKAVETLLGGTTIGTGGNLIAVRFDATETEQFLAVIDWDGKWIVTYEAKGEDGQRDWVDVARPTHPTLAESFCTAGAAARALPLM